MSNLISEHPGHLVTNTKKTFRNSYKIWEDEKGKYVEMFAKHGSFYFDYDDLEYLTKFNGKNITWCMHKNIKVRERKVYYIKSYINGSYVGMHQYIMKHYGKGSKGITVDHIDGNPLNNRRYNLRLATKSEQRNNKHYKPARNKNTQPLPEGIKQDDLPKYVYYSYNKRKTKLGYYDCFIIQGHPAQKDKKTKWTTQLSMKVSVHEKFKQVLNKIKEFDEIINRQHNQTAGKP